jgi:8-oxo-dGTP diphosphatase
MLEFGARQANVAYIERPGAYGIIRNSEAEYAIIRTPKGCFLPGGGVDEGENVEAALRREVLEETGIGVDVERKVGVAAQYLISAREGIYYKKIGHFYVANFGERVTETFEAEHELIWMSFDKASAALKHRFQVWAIASARGG